MSPLDTLIETTVKVTVHPPVHGGRWALSYFPRRSGDTKIYFTPDGEERTPNRPREVTWEVIGLQAGQTLEIHPKSTSTRKHRLAGHPFKITPTTGSGRSGEAVAGPGQRPREDGWAYDVILKHASGLELARLDPDIIIIEDP